MRTLIATTVLLGAMLIALALIPPSEFAWAASAQPIEEPAAEPATQPAEEVAPERAPEPAPDPAPEPPAESAIAPAEEEEVITTESGLNYMVLKTGDGPQPSPGQRVVVHYHGTLEDGTVFDSSVERGRPAVFPIGVGRLIRAWDEAIPMMSVGSKWRLICPPELAYGSQGRPGIPPDSTLIFEVELLDVQ